LNTCCNLHYHQVVGFFHAVLPFGRTSSRRFWTTEHVRCSSSASPSRHAHTALRRRPVDHLLLLRGSIKDASHNRAHAPRHGHCPCATQARAASTLPHRPCPTIWASISPLLAKETCGFQRGGVSRCVVKRTRCSSRQPKFSHCRLRPPSMVHGGSHLLPAGSPLPHFNLREVFKRARTAQAEFVPSSSSRRQPALLAQLRA
jgi:hypothetical protein